MLSAWDTRDVGGLFKSIARYTRLVGFFKIFLILFALFIAGSVIVLPIINSGENSARLTIHGINDIKDDSKAEKPIMNHLQYHGIDEKFQPYTVTADSGVQLDEDNVELTNPTADVFLNEGKWIAVTATKGLLHVKSKLVDISGSVDVFYDNGYEFTTDSVHVDINQKKMTTDAVVKGQGPSGTLVAQGGMIATQEDGRILFKGPVKMTIYMGGK